MLQLLVDDELHNPRLWRDFTSDPVALLAQEAHALTCRHCRAKAGLGPPVKTKRKCSGLVVLVQLNSRSVVADPTPLPHRTVEELEGLVLTLLDAMRNGLGVVTEGQDPLPSTDKYEANDDSDEEEVEQAALEGQAENSALSNLPHLEGAEQVRQTLAAAKLVVTPHHCA